MAVSPLYYLLDYCARYGTIGPIKHKGNNMSDVNSLLSNLSAQQREPEIQQILDDLVHDLHDEAANDNNPHCPDEASHAYELFLDLASRKASDLNNQGQDAQLSYIAAAGATDRLLASLAELAGDTVDA